MKSVIASLVAVAGMSVAANAVVNTSIVWQVSTNNSTWSNNVNLTIPPSSQLVYVRALVSYTGTASPAGLGSFVFQPTVSNWAATDTLSAFVAGGPTSASFPTGVPGGGGNTTTPVGVVTNQSDNTQFGRVSPWGRSALSSTSYLTGFVHTGGSGQAPAGNWLRIAQHQVTSWIGGTGNTTGGSGVPIAQLSNVGRAGTDPAFNSSLTNIVVFKMGLNIDLTAHTGANNVLTIDSPTDGFGNRNTDSTSPDFGNREIYWFGDINSESTGSIRGTAAITDATITVTPTPASLALLGLGGLAVGRRRR
jgi:MYXO-CTERM domain-containing protein